MTRTAIARVREQLRQLVPDSNMPFADRRTGEQRFVAAFEMPADMTVAPWSAEGLTGEMVTPDGCRDGELLLHFHGGGYVMGSAAASRPLTTAMARATGAHVLSIDYALAPESPYPAAVVDAVDAYRHVLDRTPARGVALLGESAGGGLAVACLLAARDRWLPLPACAVAISPWSDLTCAGASYETNAALDPLLGRSVTREMAAAYLDGQHAHEPLASPNRGDLRSLPPLLVQVGAHEVLLDDARDLVAAATRAGTPARLCVWDEMIHVWHMFHDILPEGAMAIDEAASFVRDAWREPAPPTP